MWTRRHTNKCGKSNLGNQLGTHFVCARLVKTLYLEVYYALTFVHKVQVTLCLMPSLAPVKLCPYDLDYCTFKYQFYTGSTTAEDDYTIRNLTIIKGKFESLHQNMCTGLQAKLSEEQVRKELCPFLLSIVHCKSADWLPDSFNLEEIFKAMTKSEHWDYWNYFPLESLVEKFGDKDMLSKIEQYKQDRSSFQVATKIKDYIPVATTLLEESDGPIEPCPLRRDVKYCWKLQIKLKEHVTEYSLDYLENLSKSLAKILFLSPLSLVLDTILKASPIVVWLIPAELGPKVIKCAQQNIKMFARYHSLLSLTVGDECVYEKVKL